MNQRFFAAASTSLALAVFTTMLLLCSSSGDAIAAPSSPFPDSLGPMAAPHGTASAPAAAQAGVAEDDDDDFDKAGPVDRTPRLSGAISASHRSTVFDVNKLPDGKAMPDEYTFQVEHTHLKFNGDLTSKLSWEVLPCVTHMNGFSVISANFSYEIAKPLRVTAGRFLLPFGQFNVRSLPGSYGTVSRPLLYQSHEDRMIRVDGATPTNFIFTPRDDTGVKAEGSFWLGSDEKLQVSYAAYVTNGLRGVSPQMGRFWDDNNNGKQLGGRVSASWNGEKLNVGVGASYLKNKVEKSLNQRAWGIDAVLAYQYATARRITLRGEWVDTTREVSPDKNLLKGDEGIKGGYVSFEAALTGWLGVYYQFDTLTQRRPRALLNETFADRELTTNRHAGGLAFTLQQYLQLRFEYSRWLHPQGVPDAHRVSIQTVVVF